MTLLVRGHRIEAVVFDFDGVLADTEHGWAVAETALCSHYAVEYTDDLARGTHGVGLDDSVRHLTAGVPGRVHHEQAARLMRELAETHVPTHLAPIEGAAEVVRDLADRVPVAIASNTERRLLERLVTELGLDRVVHEVVAATDVPLPKPAPDIYLEATRRLGSPPAHTLVVEDSPTGGQAAAAAGCVVLALCLAEAPVVTDLSWADLRADSYAQVSSWLTPAGSPAQVPAGSPAQVTDSDSTKGET